LYDKYGKHNKVIDGIFGLIKMIEDIENTCKE